MPSTRKPATRRKPAAARRRSTTRNPTPPRRTAGLALGSATIAALAVAAAAGVVGLLRRFAAPREEGHVPTDLMRDTHPGPEDRAIPAFRPDPAAPVAPEDREALRPALGRPSLVEPR